MIAKRMQYIFCAGNILKSSTFYLLVQTNDKVVVDFTRPSSFSILTTKENSPSCLKSAPAKSFCSRYQEYMNRACMVSEDFIRIQQVQVVSQNCKKVLSYF